jgi:hypothetical protein
MRRARALFSYVLVLPLVAGLPSLGHSQSSENSAAPRSSTPTSADNPTRQGTTTTPTATTAPGSDQASQSAAPKCKRRIFSDCGWQPWPYAAGPFERKGH